MPSKLLKNAAPLGQHFCFPRPRTYREPRDHTVALSPPISTALPPNPNNLQKPETSTLISKNLFVLGSRANHVRDYPRTQELRLR